MTDNLHATEIESRFPCPVPWCEGRTWTHGADGAGPDAWMHEAAAITLPGGLVMQRWATAPDGERWSLRTATYNEISEASSPGDLAAMLDAASTALRSIASDLATGS